MLKPPGFVRVGDKMEKLAPYASNPEDSKGRLYPEASSKGRNCFQRDRDRILHASAFRRLKGKTQVFVVHEDEDYRTRLTHTLEVSQIARSIAREMLLNEDLTEALALSHDLGHSPFGHAGEEALNDCMNEYGGFDHNAQSLKTVTYLERSYAQFNGLNLSWEALEGLAKHNGPITGDKVPEYIKEYNQKHDLLLHTFPSAEAQVAALCDDIAYNSHDIADGLHAGLFTPEQISEVPFIGEAFAEVNKLYPNLDFYRKVHESVRRLINAMVNDVVEESRKRLGDLAPKSADAVRELSLNVISFSDAMAENDRQIKTFLFPHMYRHYKVRRATSKGRRIIKDLFNLYLSEPDIFHSDKDTVMGKPKTEQAFIISDYIAGLTDAAATDEFCRFFNAEVKV